MTTHLWVISVALGVTALVNWRSVLRGDHVVERLTKPLVVLLLMGLAWSLHWEGRAPGSPPLLPGVVALAFCLVGDVALLRATETRFLVGLAAFPWPLLVAVPALVLLHAKVGRDIVRHSGAQRVPVFVYQLVLSALVLVAAWKGDWLLLLGCAVFVVSDAVLGHDRFVHERRWAPLRVIVTYHVAQALIVVALFR